MLEQFMEENKYEFFESHEKIWTPLEDNYIYFSGDHVWRSYINYESGVGVRVPEDKLEEKTSFGTLRETLTYAFNSYLKGEYYGEATSRVKVFNIVYNLDLDLTWPEHLASGCHKPKVEEGGSISYYKNIKDALRGRRTTQKLGRVLRATSAVISDKDLETLVKAWERCFVKEDYTLHVGDSREDFAKAYGDDLAPSKDPSTSSARKSLHNSCMRGVEVRTPEGKVSPAEVYASGDFKIAWVENPEGKIAGRVVYATHNDKPEAGPCYGVCEQSLDMLERHLKSVEAIDYNNDSSWEGAKLLRIEAGPNTLVGPYSDLDSSLEDKGDYLVFSGYGGLSAERTDGYLGGTEVRCDECGDDVDPDYITQIEQGSFCECCYDELFVYSSETGEYLYREDAILVYSYAWFGLDSRWLPADSEDIVFCELLDEYWDEGDTIHTNKSGYLPTKYAAEHPELLDDEEEEEEV